MDYEGSPEPIDFDFFDDGPSTKRSKSPNQSSRNGRPLSGKRSNSARGNDGDYDRESVRSVTSSRSSVSVRIPTATPTHDDGHEADYYSDDFDSDKDDSKERNRDTFRFKDDTGALKGKSKTKSGGLSLASKSNSNSKGDAKSRPKSSVVRHRQRARSDSSSSDASSNSAASSSSFSSESTRSNRSERDNESVTSVSPLQSPASSPIPKLEYDEQEMERETEKLRSVRFEEDEGDESYTRGTKSSGKERPKTSKARARPQSSPAKTPGYSNYRDNPPLRATEANELSMLLRAVLEMDESNQSSELASLHKDLKKPLTGKRKNRPQSAPNSMPHQRMNMSFSNDEVKRIDRENRRLLEKIVGRSNKAPGQGSRPVSANCKPIQGASHSAVRRQRDQRRIEIENLQILKRIEAARANPQIKKDSLLDDFHRQKQYANQVSKSPGAFSDGRSRPTSAKQSGKSYSDGGMSKASSMSSLGTDYTTETVTSSSSYRSRHRNAKPAWDDRFYLNQ